MRTPETYLLRYTGELSIKAPGTRKRFVKGLARNVSEALAASGLEGRVEPTRTRMFVHGAPAEAATVLARVAGIQSVSPAYLRPWREVDDLVRVAEELFAPVLAGKTFAARVRRAGSRHRIPIVTPDVERRIGASLAAHAAGVNLKHPEVRIEVEVFERRAFFMGERIEGFGGLPLCTEGRAVSLFSGGFDSAVASWLMLRRGVRLDYVLCTLGGGDAHRDSALAVVKVLADRWSYGTEPFLNLIDLGPLVEALQERCPPSLWQVLLKRLMLRAAEEVARMVKAPALVTGEAVGQVSSQTLQNLAVISEATELPILRPLLTFNKEEILDRARHIGTYDLSAKVPEACALVRRKPATHARAPEVDAAEALLPEDGISRAVATRAVLDLRRLDLDLLRAPSLEVDEVPQGATVIDLRPPTAYRDWHYPEALHLPFSQALEAYASFNRQQRYLLYCEVGLKSAHLAELMTQAGYQAQHARGGVRRLRRWLS